MADTADTADTAADSTGSPDSPDSTERESELTVGARIIVARKQKRLSRRELARRSGVAEATLRDIEMGRARYPRLDTLRPVARVLGMSVEELAEAEGGSSSASGAGLRIVLAADEVGKLLSDWSRLSESQREVVFTVIGALLAQDGQQPR